MSAKPQNIDNKEIDLSQISKKIGNFFEGISNSIFEGILFIKRNIVLFISLFIIGAGAGYYLDKTSDSYGHEIIVAPNFGSTDYLYDKIDLLQSKIKERDTVFLKSIGIQNPSALGNIKIEPIIDIYSFVNNSTGMANNAQNTQNFELVKLLAEDSDINKVIKEKITSKNYGRHIINISTKGFITDKSMIDPLMSYLNRNEYYQNVQKVHVDNIKARMKQDEVIIKQIDDLLGEFSATTTNNQKSDKLVYYNENTQLNEIIKTKNNLVAELGGGRMELVNNAKIVMKNSSVINVKNTKGINGKMKLILPLLLIFAFIGINIFRNFYRRQSAKLTSK